MKALLIDDHAIVRSGLRRLFAALPQWAILEAANGRTPWVWCRPSGRSWWCWT